MRQVIFVDHLLDLFYEIGIFKVQLGEVYTYANRRKSRIKPSSYILTYMLEHIKIELADYAVFLKKTLI